MNSAKFALPELSTRQQNSGEAWHEFLSTPSMSMGVYALPAGSDDRDSHAPHGRDEVYVATAGRGILTVGDDRVEIAPGVIVFVKAGIEHHFHSIEEDLTVLVFFAGDGAA